jgi:pimeloyl-ACP methyl ester carboxylesterase
MTAPVLRSKYDPDRIPVVLIHGLTSIPQMWIPTISAIESDQELRGRYQFWVFAYPTGDPIALSALKFRESLAQVYQLYSKTRDMVLISHSMGGLLSHMQAVTTKRVLWDRVFQGDADRLYAKLPADNVVKRALIFDANPGCTGSFSFASPIAAAIWRPTGSVHSAWVLLACRANS